jgi:hypothetical protein
MGGLRLLSGELQIMADPVRQNLGQEAADPAWLAVDGASGTLIPPDGQGTTPGSLKLDFNDRFWKKSGVAGLIWVTGALVNKVNKKRASQFCDVQIDDNVGPAARLFLQAWALAPFDANPSIYGYGKLYANNDGGDLRVHCGGSFHDHVDAGPFFNRMCDDPDHATAGIGFRAAYIEEQPS